MIQAMDHGRSDEWYKRALDGTNNAIDRGAGAAR